MWLPADHWPNDEADTDGNPARTASAGSMFVWACLSVYVGVCDPNTLLIPLQSLEKEGVDKNVQKGMG